MEQSESKPEVIETYLRQSLSQNELDLIIALLQLTEDRASVTFGDFLDANPHEELAVTELLERLERLDRSNSQ